MELDWLETFLAVVDTGGFTAAALQVHRSQSRVSAHIAALERDLGVRLIDRAHRPATLTPAGRVFAAHSREILAELTAARASVGALRAMENESLAVLTAPYIGAVLFPGVLADVLAQHPSARVALSEQGWSEPSRSELGDGFVLAVLPVPTRAQSMTSGQHEQVLWRERIQVVVPLGHELAVNGEPVPLVKLVQHPLVMTGGPRAADIVALLGERGLEVSPRANVDAAPTLIEMTRRGVGVGVESAVALAHTDTEGLAVLEIDDETLVREVAAHWHDVLTSTEVGQILHDLVLAAPLPRGALVRS